MPHSSTKFYLGLTGPIGCGKDTSAGILCDALRKSKMGRVGILAFADPVRHATAAIYNIAYELTLTQEGKATFIPEWDMTVRDMLRLVGTEGGRHVHGYDIWIKNLQSRAGRFDIIVVPDVRFSDEARFIRDNGLLIHLERPDNPHAGLMSNHESDQGVPFSYEDELVVNNGDLGLLEVKLADAVVRRTIYAPKQ